ncbi:MAG: phenylacetic acid degradation operon negative regulatory protein PaaX [Methylobacteriaceae bacterium]|nr:phenylacetic acid degradation operon negative regulatory protein PaaX [Methylobacteriaceae bacterium]
MVDAALQAILHDLRREPSRTPSVVITVYGDAIAPRGGSVWLGTLNAFFGALGIAEGAVRTAASRLAADGWLERRRLGRNSFYRLAEKGRATFEAATRHIYNPAPARFDGRFRLVLLPPEHPSRDGVRAALEAAGFGSPAPGLWMASRDAALPPEVAGAIALEASAEPGEAVRLASLAWRLDRVADGYRRFLSAFGPLGQALVAGRSLAEPDAFTARILLIHAFRRVVLRDPELPRELLPSDWPGEPARALCAGLYAELLPPSERWLDAHGLTEDGPLPPPGPELMRRFQS